MMSELTVDNFTLLDDGTMDTVIQCDECGVELRYTYSGDGLETYDAFIEWCFEDAASEHECEVDEEKDE